MMQSLRKYIKSFAKQSLLIDKIGYSQMEEQIQRKTRRMIYKFSNKAKDFESESGIESSLDEVDIRNYLDEVISEMKKKKIGQ